MCMSIDNARATPILGITTPSVLLRNSSIRLFINPSIPCHGQVPGELDTKGKLIFSQLAE